MLRRRRARGALPAAARISVHLRVVPPMSEAELLALSPLDGRYARDLTPLRPLLSEFGLIRERLRIEIAWLVTLAEEPGIVELPMLPAEERHWLDALAEQFGAAEALEVKDIERITRHDVKALEYWLKRRLGEREALARHREWVHFALTSEDVNNLAWALLLARLRSERLLPAIDSLYQTLRTLALEHAEQPMLARTHGQPASPTTVGKEFAVFAARLERQRALFATIPILGKFSGATGNFNAHRLAYPDVEWPVVAERFVRSLGLEYNPLTTQIEPHDWIAEYLQALSRIATILLDLARDLWGYVALGLFRQKAVAEEVGSSAMPHKINPIDFENAEGNLGIARALCTHFAEKLPISRWQRDLSDSTVLRNLGVAVGHLWLAFAGIERGLGRIAPDRARLDAELDAHWEVLAEAIQTLMRRYGLQEPYEQLKALTRGQALDAITLRRFVASLPLPENERERLLELTPAAYTGFAAELARSLRS